MAALAKIASTYSIEIVNGIAWVAIWKEGRSWNAQYYYIDEDEQIEAEDLKEMREILKKDPNAVMLNGVQCGHFWEDMTNKDIENGIRWHYENHLNLLKDWDDIVDDTDYRDAEMVRESLKEILKDMAYNKDNCERGDIARSYHTTGWISGVVWALRQAGHYAESGTYTTDSGCDRFAYLKIDGVYLVKNEEIQQAFFDVLSKNISIKQLAG